MNDEIKKYFQPGKQNLLLIYILYLCGVVAPLFCVIGAVLAYINKDESTDIYQSHYIFVLRTFWISFIWIIIATITNIIFIDMIVRIWFIIRIVVGMNFLINDKSHSNPNTLFIK